MRDKTTALDISIRIRNFWSKEAGVVLLRSLLISIVFAVAIAIVINKVADTAFTYSLLISVIYASVCAILVVFPGSTLLAVAKSTFKAYVTILSTILLATLIGTLLAELVLAKTLFRIPFVPFGEDHLFWLNFLLSLSAIAIVSRWKSKEVTLEEEWVTFRSSDGVRSVRPADIQMIYAKNKYVFVCTSEGELLADKTLKVFEQELPGDLIRVSRSHILNTSNIKAMRKDKKGRWWLKYVGRHEAEVCVGVTYISKLKQYFEPSD